MLWRWRRTSVAWDIIKDLGELPQYAILLSQSSSVRERYPGAYVAY